MMSSGSVWKLSEYQSIIDMKKKLRYIAPHLSTGGLPQYLCKKIELIGDYYDIYVIEWSNHTGGKLVVQRNKILNLV